MLNNDLSNRFDSHSITEASGLRTQFRSSSFIVNSYVAVQKMSQQLQGSTFEIANEMVSVVAAQLNDIRDDAPSEFQNICTKGKAMAA